MQSSLAKWMKIGWPLDEKAARNCLLVNLMFWPGLGSVLARRKVGWVQMAMSLLGLFTVAVALQMFMAMIWRETRTPTLQDSFVWVAATGFGLFIGAWIWGLFTGLSIQSETKATRARNTPPPLPTKS